MFSYLLIDRKPQKTLVQSCHSSQAGRIERQRILFVASSDITGHYYDLKFIFVSKLFSQTRCFGACDFCITFTSLSVAGSLRDFSVLTRFVLIVAL